MKEKLMRLLTKEDFIDKFLTPHQQALLGFTLGLSIAFAGLWYIGVGIEVLIPTVGCAAMGGASMWGCIKLAAFVEEKRKEHRHET